MHQAIPSFDLKCLPEDALLKLASDRNDDAFRELVRRSWEGCLHVAVRVLGNREDAIDEVQDAFWKAYTHLSFFNRQSRFSTWVTRIAINRCLMRLRQTKRLRFVSYESVSTEGAWYMAHEAAETRTPEQLLGIREVKRVLQREVRRIPVLLREPLELRYMRGLALEDVAERLGISVPAAKSRLHRAQCYLRDRMLPHCGLRGVGTLMREA